MLFRSDAQAKAILDLKLSRLSKLDINKLFDEQNQLNKERDRIEQILNNETLLKKEIEKGLREVAEKFGDARRTKVLNIEKEEDEPIDNKKLLINLTNKYTKVNEEFLNELEEVLIMADIGITTVTKFMDKIRKA